MALTDFVPKRLRDETAPTTAAPPTPPRYVSAGMTSQPLSEVAAMAAQHVNDLEQALAEMARDRDGWRNRAELAEAACANLHEDIMVVRAERDRFQAHAITIRTQLETSAKIILDAMQSPLSRELKEREVPAASKAEAQAAVDTALTAIERAITEPEAPAPAKKEKKPRASEGEAPPV